MTKDLCVVHYVYRIFNINIHNDRFVKLFEVRKKFNWTLIVWFEFESRNYSFKKNEPNRTQTKILKKVRNSIGKYLYN